jgi:hypothetical protein
MRKASPGSKVSQNMATVLSQDKACETLASGPSRLSVEQPIVNRNTGWERPEWHDLPTPLIGQPAPSLFRPISIIPIILIIPAQFHVRRLHPEINDPPRSLSS